jgi:dTMP kinase
VSIKGKFRSLGALFSNRDFRSLCHSQVLAGLGEWLATMALIALVWDRTHSALASGIVLVFRILPAAVLGSFLGSFVDRLDRKRVLVACTAGRAVVYGAIPLVGGIAAVLALALVAEVAALAYMSARDATLPRLIAKQDLPTANAISMASAYAAMPFGSGLFALMSLFRDPVALGLLVAGGLLGFATLIVGRINSHAVAAAQAAPGEPVDKPSFRAGMRALREIFRQDPILRRVVIGGSVAATGGGVIITLGLSYVRGTLHAGPGAYSGLLIAFCFGAVAGVAALQKGRGHLHKVFHGGVGAMGAILISMALFPSTAMGFGMGFVFGGAFMATFLGGITILQERIHDSVRGRAFALAHSGLRVSAVAMGVLGAWGAKMIGPASRSVGVFRLDGTQFVLGAVGLLLFAAAVAMFRPARVRA